MSLYDSKSIFIQGYLPDTGTKTYQTGQIKKHSKLKLHEYTTFFCSRDRIPPADSSDLLHCKQSRKQRSAHLLFVYMICECEQIGDLELSEQNSQANTASSL